MCLALLLTMSSMTKSEPVTKFPVSFVSVSRMLAAVIFFRSVYFRLQSTAFTEIPTVNGFTELLSQVLSQVLN